MTKNKYRKIERSKPVTSTPSDHLKRKLLMLSKGLMPRRAITLVVLTLFFVLGASIGGYFGSKNLNEKQNDEPYQRTPKSLNDSHKVSKPRLSVNVYAYNSQSPKNAAEKLAMGPQVLADSINAEKNTPDFLKPKLTIPHRKSKTGYLKKIAVVIDDLGVDQQRTQKAISLAGPLNMAFLPYGINLRRLTKGALANGHELIVHLPMEPKGGAADPGPNALLNSLSDEQIRDRVNWNLSQFQGFVGVNNHMGSEFTSRKDGMKIVMSALKDRGLFFLDSLTSSNSIAHFSASEEGIKFLARDVFIDNESNITSIKERLNELEEISARRGYAIGIAHPYDTTLEALRHWIPTLPGKAIKLVPLSLLTKD